MGYNRCIFLFLTKKENNKKMNNKKVNKIVICISTGKADNKITLLLIKITIKKISLINFGSRCIKIKQIIMKIE